MVICRMLPLPQTISPILWSCPRSLFSHTTQRRRVPEFMHWAISEFVPGCLNSHEGMQNQTAGSDYTSLGWKSLMTSWMFSSPLYKFMRGM